MEKQREVVYTLRRDLMRGGEKPREFILETDGNYPKQICIVMWGDNIDTFGVREGEQLTAHIDIASRVPVGIGDRVRFRGLYEWNDLGGLVHWTHHDPHGLEDGGWVRFRTREYA